MSLVSSRRFGTVSCAVLAIAFFTGTVAYNGGFSVRRIGSSPSARLSRDVENQSPSPSASATQQRPGDPATLRVCADPNNMPFSNRREEGFENRIAQLVGLDLHQRIQYFWQPQRRGFVRTTISAGHC